MSRERTIVIGLDGGTFKVIDRLVAEGRMPTLERLSREGVRGALESTIITNSFPAWTTCTTGVNPGKHGIFYALLRDRTRYGMKLMNSSDVKARRLWDLLNDAGLKAGVVNVPGTYPPQPLDGFLITDMLTPSLESRLTHPDELKAEMLERLGDYIIDVPIGLGGKDYVRERLHRSIDLREELALWLLDRHDPDFFMCIFTELDRCQHRFWNDADPEHPLFEEGNPYQGVVDEIYERCDRAVGRILDHVGPDARVFIVSDHGFAGYRKNVLINHWLIDQGLLVLKAQPSGPGLLERAVGRVKRAFKAPEPPKDGASYVSKWTTVTNSENDYLERVDWSRTKVYFAQHGGLRINLAGREPSGIVTEAEYPQVVEQIRREIVKLRFPDTGEQIFDTIVTKEEAFEGPFLEDAPDVLIDGSRRSRLRMSLMPGHGLFVDAVHAGHDEVGIFYAVGPGLRKGAAVEGARLLDVTPTVLYQFGLPLTEDMDGRVLEEIFTEEFRSGRSVTRKGTSVVGERSEEVFSEDEREELEGRLRDLGYIN
jgi:predicted AlkP superfamily phosphohydrolase/phosphomutase